MIVSLWNLTSILAALLPRCLSNFRAMGKVYTRILWHRNFMGSCGKTSYRLVNRATGYSAIATSIRIFRMPDLVVLFLLYTQYCNTRHFVKLWLSVDYNGRRLSQKHTFILYKYPNRQRKIDTVNNSWTQAMNTNIHPARLRQHLIHEGPTILQWPEG